MRSVHRTPPLGRKIHCPLPTIALSPLAATLMDPPASVANKRLTAWLTPLDATLTKNRGYHPSSQKPYLSSSAPSSVPYLLTSLPPYLLTSLPPYFITSRNGYALSAAMRGCCEKGAPSSGEKIVSRDSVVRGRRRWRWRRVRGAVELLNVHSVPAARHRVIRRHGKERGSGFLPLDIRQHVTCVAKARIVSLAHHHHLQIVGIPMFSHDGDRFFVPHFSRGDC